MVLSIHNYTKYFADEFIYNGRYTVRFTQVGQMIPSSLWNIWFIITCNQYIFNIRLYVTNELFSLSN